MFLLYCFICYLLPLVDGGAVPIEGKCQQEFLIKAHFKHLFALKIENSLISPPEGAEVYPNF